MPPLIFSCRYAAIAATRRHTHARYADEYQYADIHIIATLR